MGSPIIDLMYFLTSSPAYDVLEQSKEELVFTYYETLAVLLQRLNYKKSIPSLMDLQVELLKHGALGNSDYHEPFADYFLTLTL